jgi:hypothetical protein
MSYLDDGYPDDWYIPPSSAAPSSTPPASNAQPSSLVYLASNQPSEFLDPFSPEAYSLQRISSGA